MLGAPQLAHDGPGAQRRPAPRHLVGGELGQPPDPAAQARERRARPAPPPGRALGGPARPGSRRGSRAARAPASSPAATAGPRGRRRPRRAAARRAGRPRRVRAGRPRSRPPRRRWSARPPGHGRSSRSRSTSSSVRMPRADSGSLGTPMSVARGSGSSAPRVHTEAAVVAGVTRSPSAPTRAARSTASGRRASIDSAPTSTTWPATASRRSLPPSRSLPSSTVTSAAGRASSTSSAAVRPAMPPPTTTTRGRVVTAGTDMPPSLSRRCRNPRRAPGPGQRSGARRDAPGPAPVGVVSC